jgi:hypothetical protein
MFAGMVIGGLAKIVVGFVISGQPTLQLGAGPVLD